MAEPVALIALGVDAAVGWPAGLYRRIGHSVGGFARLIDALVGRWNRPEEGALRRRLFGVATMAVLLGVTLFVTLAITGAARALLGRWAFIAIGLAAAPALAQRSLHDHVAPVGAALAAGDLPRARACVARIVGRDVDRLDEAGVARAGIESLAESFCDGVVAPLFWLVLLGLPGVWAYKAINTADSMIGHREAPWGPFGWAAARIDDGANWVPARLAALLLCLAGAGGWRIVARDARAHASPNAGWPEAAMAGVLGLRLAGPIAYGGVWQAKPWIGDGRADAGPADVTRALRLYRRACGLAWIGTGVCAWLA